MQTETEGEQQQPAGSWQFHTEDEPASHTTDAALAPDHEEVEWTASEFIAHQKNPAWFLLMALATAACAAIVYLLLQDWIAVGVIIFFGLLFGITAARKPRTQRYRVDSRGITIGEKFHPYEGFKSFSIIEEGAFNSIALMPLKRFMPILSLYYPPDQEHKIINTLGSYLPMEMHQLDSTERLMRKIRF